MKWLSIGFSRARAKPYLLVNFGNLHIRANMAKVYAKNIARFQSMLLGTYRYGMPPTFTGVAVALGTRPLLRTSSLRARMATSSTVPAVSRR
jgi:hypothetical protein